MIPVLVLDRRLILSLTLSLRLTLAASSVPSGGTSPTVTDTDHTNPPAELPHHWDIKLLVTGQASVVTDSDRYHYLTYSYQGKEFCDM